MMIPLTSPCECVGGRTGEKCCLRHDMNLLTSLLSITQSFVETRGLAGSHWLNMSFLPWPLSAIKTLTERESVGRLKSGAPRSPQAKWRKDIRSLFDSRPNV